MAANWGSTLWYSNTSGWSSTASDMWQEPEPTFIDDYAALRESLKKMKEKDKWNKPEND